MISGVLESIDSATGKAVIRTDLGRPIFVDITKPYLLERIVQGERVTIQVNQRGEAVKVIDAPVPELKHPAPN